jgi:hypothetical protein
MGLPADAVLLGALNKFYKFTPSIFDVWCALLRRFPHAFLVLVSLSRCLSPPSLARFLAVSLARSSSLFLPHPPSLSLPSSRPPLFSLSAPPPLTLCFPSLCMHVFHGVHILLIRQHTSAYVSIRQHTSAYVSMRQHTSQHTCVVVYTYYSTPALYIHVLFLYASSSYYMCLHTHLRLLYAAVYICSLLINVFSSHYMCLHTHLRLHSCTSSALQTKANTTNSVWVGLVLFLLLVYYIRHRFF